jgi:MFS family permease
MNFFALRATLNLGFALGILAFFTSETTIGLVAAAIVFGISNAGGDVAWGLWVTKFAKPERVADYMSVHTFLTGVRGVLAPFAAFHAVNSFSLPTLGWIAAGLIVAASAFLLPEITQWKSHRKPDLVIEEVED